MGKCCGWLWYGVDWQSGDGGSNWLVGGAGRDWLFGGAGDDRLDGQGGHDWLFGQWGNDQLAGGGGSDWLLGGRGDDVAVYHAGDGHDVFHGGAGTDVIRLDSVVAGWSLNLWRVEAALEVLGRRRARATERLVHVVRHRNLVDASRLRFDRQAIEAHAQVGRQRYDGNLHVASRDIVCIPRSVRPLRSRRAIGGLPPAAVGRCASD
jgi:Ca2+-binding RTX toxin-like protein